MAYEQMTREELVAELRARDEAPESLTRSLNLLETLHDAETDFLTVDAEDSIFNRMLTNFLKVTGCEYGYVDEYFVGPDGKPYLEARAITNIAWDEASRAIYKKLVSGEIRFDNLKSLYGEVILKGVPMIFDDPPNDPRRTGIPPGHPPLTSFLGIPLIAGGECVGQVGLANAPGGFPEGIIHHLAPLTQVCSILMLSLKIDRRRMRALNELETLAAELKISNEELQTFAYVASHDLQTPLRSIQGFARLLDAEYGDTMDPEARGWLDHIGVGAERLQTLLRDLLEYSRAGGRAKPLALPLAEVLQEVTTAVRAVLDERGAVVTWDEELPVVCADRSQLSRVLQNLMGNAIKYCEQTPRIHISAEVDGQTATVRVADNGIGIAPKHASRVFEVFHRLHSADDYAGSGVGLAVCRRIIAAHGGRIWVDSVPGTGSTFCFSLPMVEGA